MTTTYSCFNCNAELKWNPVTQSFKCEYCDSEFHESDFADVTNVKEEQSDVPDSNEASTEDSTKDSTEDAKDGTPLVSYVCEYCSAQVITTTDTAATFCVYCQRPVILENNLSGEFKPTYVIPFSTTKKDAKEAFRNFLKNKIFVPDSFSLENNVDKITGMYVPFWLFDSELEFDFKLTGTITSRFSDSRYHYVKSDMYDVKRAGTFTTTRVPADGSSKISDDIMAAIEPFDWSKLQDFSMPYLSGFLAERYDISSEKVFDDVVIERLKTSLHQELMDTCKQYDRHSNSNLHSSINTTAGHYALLPVWLLYTQYEGTPYIFAMNGQTGKLQGDLPMDAKKIKKYTIQKFVINAAIFSVLAFLFLFIL